MLVVGVPTTGYKLLYKLPSFPSSKTVYGSIFPISPGNRAIVLRTWGLQQFHAFHSNLPESERVGDKMLTYGKTFKYDEFLEVNGKAGAFLRSLSVAVMGICLMMFSPVCLCSDQLWPIGARLSCDIGMLTLLWFGRCAGCSNDSSPNRDKAPLQSM